MSVIIVLIGGLLLFANPDLRQDTYRAELGVSSLSGSVSSGSESIKGGTILGWGVSLTGEYRDETPLRHSLGIQRYDSYKYPAFENLTKSQLGYFWRPEEVSLQKDRGDYQQLRPEQKHIFTSNLKYQTMLDSVQGLSLIHISEPTRPY